MPGLLVHNLVNWNHAAQQNIFENTCAHTHDDDARPVHEIIKTGLMPGPTRTPNMKTAMDDMHV